MKFIKSASKWVLAGATAVGVVLLFSLLVSSSSAPPVVQSVQAQVADACVVIINCPPGVDVIAATATLTPTITNTPVDTYTPTETSTPTDTPTNTPTITNTPIYTYTPSTTPSPTPNVTSAPEVSGIRGYMVSKAELATIKQQAALNVQPYKQEVTDVLVFANKTWSYTLTSVTSCGGADTPAWDDNTGGTPIVYGKALAYHLTGTAQYAADVKTILQSIMTNVVTIATTDQQCRLNFAWGVPELVAAADLINDYWADMVCTGPTTSVYGDTTNGSGNCKHLFQNWLAKNPYYIVSLAAEERLNNWGAAATNALAYIADYLWDRPDIKLGHRRTSTLIVYMSPSQAYAKANQLMFDRNSGARAGDTCDDFSSSTQNSTWAFVKSQITENGIVPEDARREEWCNIPMYQTGVYENYPQVYLGNNIQQCELMLRRNDPRCYTTVVMTDLPAFSFKDASLKSHTTHLYPGRGSILRGINAVIIDAATEWRHDEALKLAYRYYHIAAWRSQMTAGAKCDQDACLSLAGVP